MAPLTIPEEVRVKAEVYTGDAAGQEKTRLLLQETGLPSGLLPLRDILECGYVEETGFVWLKQRRRVDHYFAGAGRHVSYGAEVSAVAEKGRLKKITGVKAKELLIWVSLHEICLDDETGKKVAAGSGSKLVCKALGGLSRSFPAEAFEAPPPLHDNKPPTTPAASASAAAKVEEEEEAKKLQEEVKKQQQPEEEEEQKQQAKKKDEEAEEAKANKEHGASSSAAAVDAVVEKLKDLTTTAAATKDQAVVRAEAVAARN